MDRPPTLITGPVIQHITDCSYLSKRYMRERQGDFSDTTLSAKLGSIAAGHLLLLPREVSEIDVDTDNTDMIALTEVGQLEKGRTNRSNDIKFGQLYLSSTLHPSSAELIAAKYLHRLRIPSELNAAAAVNKRFGDRLAFSPIGIVRRGNDFGYLTRYEHSVMTLDNILWHPDATNEQRLSAMSRAGLWMAALHNHGIIHGDAQAKNIAFDNSNKPRYPDLEKATDINHGLLDTETKRLLDIIDLYNPTYMPPVSGEETRTFIDTYLDNQTSMYGRLRGQDIADSIRSVNERQR